MRTRHSFRGVLCVAGLVCTACNRDAPDANAQNAAGNAAFVASNAATVQASFAAEPVTARDIYKQLGGSVARVEFNGELYNGTREEGAGSGFFISDDGLLLTCKHVVPVPTNYKVVTIEVRPGSKAAPPLPAKIAWISDKLDLVLLKVDGHTPRPIQFDTQPISPGDDVMILGFPLNLDLNINKGMVSGLSPDGRFIMDTTLNPGNSGGPVFGSHGRVVGVAWGAAVKWRLGDQVVNVEGVKYFIPLGAALSSAPMQVRSYINSHTDSGTASHTYDGSINFGGEEPTEISRAENVEFVKDDHPVTFGAHRRWFEKVLAADEGYEIVSTDVSVMSSNHASPLQVHISEDRRSATARAELTSGSTVDRWRGWLLATVQLKQRKLSRNER